MLNSFVTKYETLSYSQFGYKSKANTGEAISKLISKINYKTCDVYLDIQKGFDSVKFKSSLLIDKLKRTGIGGILLEIIQFILKRYVLILELIINYPSGEIITCGIQLRSCVRLLLFNILNVKHNQF